MKLKIGEFARIGQVTVQTLRYYDDLGLLKPAEVDRFSGYRYYRLEQLPNLNRILALKDLGLSLEQITRLVREEQSPAELRSMLGLKRDELRQQLHEQLDRLERIEARMRLMSLDDFPLKCEVVLKRAEPLRVVSLRGIIPTYWDEGHLWRRLANGMAQAGLSVSGNCLSLYHANEPEIDVEVCAPIAGAGYSGTAVTVRELPAVETMATTIHQGEFGGLAATYAGLLKWLDSSGYHICGPDRALYLQVPEAPDCDSDPNTLTEIQIPVCRG